MSPAAIFTISDRRFVPAAVDGLISLAALAFVVPLVAVVALGFNEDEDDGEGSAICGDAS